MTVERELTSQRIKQKMDEKHLSYRALSELTNIAKSSLQRYVSNSDSKIPMENAKLIADKLNVSLSWLMGIDGKDEAKETQYALFSNIDEAMQFIIKSPTVSAYGGYDLDKMSNDEIIEFANELAEMFKVLAKRHKK